MPTLPEAWISSSPTRLIWSTKVAAPIATVARCLGSRLSLDWAMEGAQRLAPGGRMLLYTGSAIVGGHDALREALERDLPRIGCTLRYREIDPDIFGEELERPAYAQVERIAAVGAVIEAAASTAAAR